MAEKSPAPDRQPPRDPRTGKSAAYQRMQQQAKWVELQVQQAQQRGDFDDLPGFGKPLEDLGTQHDPDWWVKKLVEREQITGVLPPALQLRTDDAQLDGKLDRVTTEREVRAELDDFNDRVRKARIQPLGGPPMITKERDVDAEVERWKGRRAARHEAQRAAVAQRETHERARRRRRFRKG
ncbi:DUF1992 domain-containing protein [Nocardioides bigeumensis]|uniref:DnaJ homologue subfamily C member 28 conserved domain-containing protein n=1 Tax=Nocardioides bigeumensis TaxID=433657 RepID=A0ABP5KQF1_9ACTN